MWLVIGNGSVTMAVYDYWSFMATGLHCGKINFCILFFLAAINSNQQTQMLTLIDSGSGGWTQKRDITCYSHGKLSLVSWYITRSTENKWIYSGLTNQLVVEETLPFLVESSMMPWYGLSIYFNQITHRNCALNLMNPPRCWWIP